MTMHPNGFCFVRALGFRSFRVLGFRGFEQMMVLELCMNFIRSPRGPKSNLSQHLLEYRDAILQLLL